MTFDHYNRCSYNTRLCRTRTNNNVCSTVVPKNNNKKKKNYRIMKLKYYFNLHGTRRHYYNAVVADRFLFGFRKVVSVTI